jgi:DNA-binding CsgD family transcriptional regulator
MAESVDAQDAAPSAARSPGAWSRPTVLRGRSEPMARALALVRGAVRHGTGGVVLICGPAGIGKTALLTEVRRQAERTGVRSLVAACDPIGQISPAAPLLAALRAGRAPLATAEQIARIVQAADEPLLLAETVADALERAAARGPLLVAVDDVQWADRVTRFAIRTLRSRLLGLPVVWLLASRDEDPRAELVGPDLSRVEHIRLTPLSGPDLTAIAHDRLGRMPDTRTRGFLEAAAGNPLLATMVLDGLERAGARGQPETVPLEFGAAIAQRLADLSDAPRDLVALVAVAGRPVPLRDAVKLLPSRPGPLNDAVAQAIDSGLLVADDDALAPRHDLVREAVCAALPESDVRTLHRSFAEYYLDAATDVSAAAAHARAAATPGDLASALILITAAEQLSAAYPDDAGDLAALAFRTLLPNQPAWLETGRRSLSVLCRTQRASEAIAVADAILARLDDADLTGAIETQAAHALWLAGRLGDLLARVERALRAEPLDPGVRARLRAARALADGRRQSGHTATLEASRALEAARASGDEDALAMALHAAGEAARNEARHRAALSCYRELRALTGAHHLAEEITTLQFLDRYDHAATLLDEVRAQAGNATSAVIPALHCARLWQDYNLGRFDEAEAEAATLVELGQQLGSSVHALDAAIVQISISLLRGDSQSASVQLALAEQLSDTDHDLRHPGLTVMYGWLAAAQGDIAAALSRLTPVAEGATGTCGYWPLWPCWMGMFFEIGAAAGDAGFAEIVVSIAELAASRNPGVASFEGMALNVRGRSENDPAMIAQAAETLARSPRPLLRAFGADGLGRMLLAHGDKAAAIVHLDRAWDDYHRTDARVYRGEVQRLMRGAGARREKWSLAAARPQAGWAALTEAERRVAMLIADGHTNRSAATELHVSVNTIGTQLRQVFTKLGVQSRVQLANTLRREERSV